jgi:hypothetical protein
MRGQGEGHDSERGRVGGRAEGRSGQRKRHIRGRSREEGQESGRGRLGGGAEGVLRQWEEKQGRGIGRCEEEALGVG